MPNPTATSSPPVEARSLEFWPMTALLAAFWVFVLLSNLLYASSMNAGFASMSNERYFAPWDSRVLQHLFLFPALVASIRASLRIGWQPLWYALPMQILLGATFAALAWPMLLGAEMLLDHCEMCGEQAHGIEHWIRNALPIWIAGATLMLLSYGFALALVTGFSIYRRYRDSELHVTRLERAFGAARLAALRMQLSPHTLFNLLHTIHGQIAWDPRAAQAMVVQLGDLLRRLLRAGEQDFVALGEELQFARQYLELQQRRFADRLSLELPDPAAAAAVWVPSLILQPLVENAVVHGLAAHDASVHIKVDYTISDGALILSVSNANASGRDPGPEGVGIRNVRERLEVHFGEGASLSSAAVEQGLWRAEIRMPCLYERR